MARVRRPQPPDTKLSEDGTKYIHPNGNFTPVYVDEPDTPGKSASADEGYKDFGYKPGDKMPPLGLDPESKERLRQWREAQKKKTKAQQADAIK